MIQGICDRRYKGEVKQYYILIPQSDPNTTILDPVDNAQRIGLHEIMSPEKADQILSFAAQTETQWIHDNAKRREQYTEILKQGSSYEIANVLKTLMLQAKSTGLSMYDKTLLRNAQKKLLSEVALAKGIPFEDAIALMERAIS